MKVHEHVTCKLKNIMGSAQSKPNSTQSLQQSKHTSKMHETLLKCKCDAMHDDLNLFKQKPTQKFHQNFTNFGKP